MSDTPTKQTTKARKPPKSWRVCPSCRGRATKLFHMSTGKYQCQQCDHEYVSPNRRLPAELEWALS